MLKRKGLYVALGAVGALVILLGTVGMAYAQGPQPPVDGRPFFGDGPRGSGHQMGGRWGWGMRGSSLVDATAEVTGLTVEDVIAALQEGQTFAQIAEEAGVDPQAIVDAFLTDREAALDDAVADGRLTQEQADQMLEEMAEHASEHLEQPWTPRSSDHDRMGQGHSGHRSRPGTGFAPRFSPNR